MVISIVGAGNVATHLGHALRDAGHAIAMVYSRTRESAETLANQLHCLWTTDIAQLPTQVDAILFCVKDDALVSLAKQITTQALCIHTAGSMPLNALPQEHRGVLYPMQTLSKQSSVTYSKIPLYLEVEKEEDKHTLLSMAEAISHNEQFVTSEQRAILHLAAVFACNFTNRCYDIAAQLLEQNDLGFDAMLPLINETARKANHTHPCMAQTGPAKRWDTNIIEKHLARLEGEMKDIYQMMSQSIHNRHKDD